MAYIDFDRKKQQQQHRPNTEAKICQNCINLEFKMSRLKPDGSTGHRQVCGIGRYFVRSFETCKDFQPKMEK